MGLLRGFCAGYLSVHQASFGSFRESKMSSPEQPDLIPDVICEKCGRSMPARSAWCPYCGNGKVVPPKSKIWLWALICFFLIPLASCGGCVAIDSGTGVAIFLSITGISFIVGIVLIIRNGPYGEQ